MTVQQFPAFVYRCPGSCQHSSGASYSYRAVADADEHADALLGGWSATLPQAIVNAGEVAFLYGKSSAQAKRVPAALLLAKVRASLAEAAPAPAPNPEPEPVSDAPPTREEMLEQAAKLKLRVDRRWSDETLLAKINAAMADNDPI